MKKITDNNLSFWNELTSQAEIGEELEERTAALKRAREQFSVCVMFDCGE